MQLIEQQLMARDTVIALIDAHDLFAHAPALSATEKVALFREAITIEGVAAAREGATDDGTISVLSISAEFGSPEKAQAVAHDLASRTIELSARARQAQTRATLEFFIEEEQALMTAIAELEDQLATFRSENDISITGSLEFRQMEIGTINSAISDVKRSRIAVQRELNSLDTSTRRPATANRVRELNQRLESLAEQQAFLETRALGLTQSLSTSPEVEREISIFDRRLQQYQDQLEEITARRTDAEIGYRLEENRQAEQLRILETAYLPEDPVAPSRRKIAFAGSVASLVLAIAVAFLLELRRPIIRSSAQMQRELGILPAVSIPEMARAKRRRKGWFRRLVARIVQSSNASQTVSAAAATAAPK
ncbi:MAG: DUF874 domain-containing protein [Rhodobacter sp.]|nr:DUF874 domain-containing protein [Rhodobacter sp.]